MALTQAQAGNPDRAGEAGAYELLINGWARSAGQMGMNTASITGLEAMRFNVGGLAFVEKNRDPCILYKLVTGNRD